MTQKIIIKYYETSYWELILGSFNEELCLCDWRYRKMRDSIDRRIQKWLDAEYQEWNSKIIEKAIQQLEQYFSWERKLFDIKLCLVGTDFQKWVWWELIRIPFWETQSYLGLSKKLENEKAIRAIASANGANALSIIIPCHRVIWSDWSLVWYAGWLTAKRKLLQLENSFTQTNLFT